jgi:hypothetical protein
MSVPHLFAAASFGLMAAVGCSHGPGSMNSGAPLDASPTVARGYSAVQSRQCGKCHQSPNAADGTLSGQTTAVPRTQSYGSNLTPDPDTGMDAWDASAVAQAVLDGIDNQGAALCPEMPREGDAGMSQDEALDIAAYLQSLTPVWHLVPASTCDKPAPPSDGGLGTEGG